MRTYEEFMVIINVAALIVAILVYVNSNDKGTKNNHPAYQALVIIL